VLSGIQDGWKRKGLSGKSIIFLFQQGGPSQFETFDPKPDAPDGVQTYNPAFDVTPAELITALITERGRRKQAFGIMRRWYGDMPDGSGSD